MAGNDLARRFTEDKYASKSDVIKALNTSLVDNIWKNILLYRQDYNIKLGLRNFSSAEYVLCFTESLDARHTLLEEKLLKILDKVDSTFEDDLPALHFRNRLTILKEVAKHNKLDANENKLRGILKNEYARLDNDNLILERYIEAMEYAYHHYNDDINQDFVFEIHRILTGELLSSYRSKEDDNPLNRVLIDRIYTSAPLGQIDNLMNELLTFIRDKDLPAISKACITYYAINSIKPFAHYSSEVATILMKTIIARDTLREVAFMLPIETILTIPDDLENKLFTDVQKYSDTTYFVIYAYELLDSISDDYLNNYTAFTSDNVENEMYSEDVIEEKEEIKEEIKEEKDIKKDEPRVAPKTETKKEVKQKEVIVEEGPIETAIRYVPRGLDEKEAAKLEQQLLEMDPSLKKKEAHFYAHHCTLGMNYTIQQYKRYCRVSYETARTSMDHLVELGYYKKEQIKNKFIYSPIKKN